MNDLGDEEHCIAITGSGDRCSRVAKNGRFCFQHDESYDTVEIKSAESAGVVNWLSSELESRAVQASDIQRDVYMNLADMQPVLENAIDDFRSGDRSLDTLLDRFVETAEEVGGDRSRNTAVGAVIGGIAGAPLGPAGIYAGIVAGSSISFFMTPKDERTIIAIPVDEIPDGADVVPSSHSAINSVSPIQIVVESAANGEDEDWVRETNTRSWDMDEVEEALSELPNYEADNSPPGGYYIQDVETGRVTVVIFGIPEDGFPAG